MSELTKNTGFNSKELFTKTISSLNISIRDIIYVFCCYIMSYCTLPDGKTPFVISVYAASFAGKKWPLFLLSSCLGLVRVRMDYVSVIYILVILISTFLMGIVSSKVRFKAICAGTLLFIISSIQALFAGAYWYDYFSILLESVLCFCGVYVFHGSITLISNEKSRRFITDMEMTFLIVSFALFLRCATGFPLVLGMDVSVILSILGVLVISMSVGASVSASSGVIFGISALGRASYISSAMGAYGFCAILTSALNRFGRWGVVLGFLIANAVMTVFFSGDVLPFDIFEVITAIIIFSLLPRKVTDFVSSLASKRVHTLDKAIVRQEKMQNVVSKRLSGLSEAYSSLAETYENCFKEKRLTKEYVIQMLDRAASNVCPSCGLKYNCWERCCKESYKAMFNMLEIAEKKGVLEKSDIPSPIKEKCTKQEEFITQFNKMFEIYKLERLWKLSLNSYGALVSKQLKEVSRSVKNTASEIGMCLDLPAEKEIKVLLDRKRIPIKDVTFLKGRSGFCAEIAIDSIKLSKKQEKIIEDVIESVTGKSVSLLNTKHTHDALVLIYRDTAAYAISVGKANVQKNGETVSGDSMIACTLPDGNFVAALSDGMGTGERAKNESKSAVGMLRDFINSGVGIEIALELINSSLLLASSGDSFATMDVCFVNLSDGRVSLFKSGASPGYVINGTETFCVESDSLPFGVINNYGKINAVNFRTDGFARVIIMSDGVYDTLSLEDGGFSVDAHFNITPNPQVMATELLKRAIDLSGGLSKDDMSVIVVDIWKKEQ